MLRAAFLVLLTLAACDCGDDRRVTGADGGNQDAGPALTCADVGGTCGCAGTCADPHPDSYSLCPQPCDGCGACSEECCVPDAVDAGGTGDAGGPADAGMDAGCSVVAWDPSTVLSVSASCGVTPGEGDSACLAIDVDGSGIITAANAGPSSTLSYDAAALDCVRGMLVGRCAPPLADMAGLEQCASGI